MADIQRARCLLLVATVLCACYQEPTPERPARLTRGGSDTVVLNSARPQTLPVRALDAAGRTLREASILYTHVDGDTLPMTSAGEVTCTRSGEFTVRAALERLTTHFVVQCRVVEYLRLSGPFQFILGDSAWSQPITLPLAAYGVDARPIAPFEAGVSLKDSGIATVRGLRLSPRTRGITQVYAHVGDRDAAMGVHVYQRVSGLSALDTLLRARREQRLFAVPLSLKPGEFIRQRLPRGGWLLAMLPENEVAPNRIQLRVEGATCEDHIFGSPRRWLCQANSDASVVLYRPYSRSPAPAATGYLLVRVTFG